MRSLFMFEKRALLLPTCYVRISSESSDYFNIEINYFYCQVVVNFVKHIKYTINNLIEIITIFDKILF